MRERALSHLAMILICSVVVQMGQISTTAEAVQCCGGALLVLAWPACLSNVRTGLINIPTLPPPEGSEGFKPILKFFQPSPNNETSGPRITIIDYMKRS